MKKIAVTISEAHAKAIERLRRHRGISRSRVIQDAVAAYLSDRALDESAAAYARGYRNHPEPPEDARAYARATAEVLGTEDWS